MHEAVKQVVVHRPGGPGALRISDATLGPPLADEVQVEVGACGINFADIAVRQGLYEAAKGLYPLCPGLEFAGIVRRTGEDVSGFRPGDRVFGATRFGAYATRINCPARYLWRLPAHWDLKRGASFPVVYLTASYALHHVGHLRTDDLVLVHSAAGGVGTALLHLLRINGNECVGVVGTSKKLAPAEKAGATHVIDKSKGDLWKRAEEISGAGFDLILDANGVSTLRESYRHLRPGGRLLIYGFASMFSHSGRKNYPKLIWGYLRTPRFSPFDLTGSNKTVAGFNLIYLFDRVELFRQLMADLLRWDAEGLLPPLPVTTFPFEQVVGAHQAMESGRSMGKIVLLVQK